MANLPSQAQAVLHFWFEELKPEQRFAKDDALDLRIREQFLPTWQAAAAGELWSWRESMQGRLAEIIVLDQFSRNLWRGDARSFAQDAMALVLSQEAQVLPEFQQLSETQCQFFLLPMMHSESIVIQDASLPLFERYCNEQTLGFAIAHRDIVAKFGRFPHRNAVLQRENTPEETEFLQQPNSSF